MKKELEREKLELYYYEGGKKITGAHSRISGDMSEIRGNVSDCGITEKDRNRGIRIEELIKDSESFTRKIVPRFAAFGRRTAEGRK